MRRLILIPGLLAILSTAPVFTSALEISDVRISRTHFHPAKSEETEIRFRIDQPAVVTLKIYDGREVLIYESSEPFRAGEGRLDWDGLDSSGKSVPNEAYHFTLSASGEDGGSVVHDLTDVTGGERRPARNVEWHPDEGLIRYRLDQPSRVNVRIGLLNNGPLLRTLIDWVPRTAGVNVEPWNGMDASGALDLTRHPKLNIFVDAYTLSENTILVGDPPRRMEFAAIADNLRQERPAQPVKNRMMHYHPQQPLETRGDFEVSISFRGQYPEDEQGVPILSGRVPVPVRLDVPDPQQRARVLARRFEPVFFVDGTYAFENEVGYLPFTWRMNADELNPGVHYVTVNLRGYEGNFGMATLKFRISAPRGK